VAEVGWLVEREAVIAKVLGRKVLPVVSRRMLKLRARKAMVLEHRRGWEQRYVVVADHQLQA